MIFTLFAKPLLPASPGPFSKCLPQPGSSVSFPPLLARIEIFRTMALRTRPARTLGQLGFVAALSLFGEGLRRGGRASTAYLDSSVKT